MFPVDVDLEPRGNHPTITIRASRDVVSQFRSMRQPPPDAEATRDDVKGCRDPDRDRAIVLLMLDHGVLVSQAGLTASTSGHRSLTRAVGV